MCICFQICICTYFQIFICLKNASRLYTAQCHTRTQWSGLTLFKLGCICICFQILYLYLFSNLCLYLFEERLYAAQCHECTCRSGLTLFKLGCMCICFQIWVFVFDFSNIFDSRWPLAYMQVWVDWPFQGGICFSLYFHIYAQRYVCQFGHTLNKYKSYPIRTHNCNIRLSTLELCGKRWKIAADLEKHINAKHKKSILSHLSPLQVTKAGP